VLPLCCFDRVFSGEAARQPVLRVVVTHYFHNGEMLRLSALARSELPWIGAGEMDPKLPIQAPKRLANLESALRVESGKRERTSECVRVPRTLPCVGPDIE
jgi:hypothetical protein